MVVAFSIFIQILKVLREGRERVHLSFRPDPADHSAEGVTVGELARV